MYSFIKQTSMKHLLYPRDTKTGRCNLCPQGVNSLVETVVVVVGVLISQSEGQHLNLASHKGGGLPPSGQRG